MSTELKAERPRVRLRDGTSSRFNALVVATCLCVTGPASARWQAFNSLVASGGNPNTTFYGAPGARLNAGPLKNIGTGAELPVQLTITGSGPIEAAFPLGVPGPGTPAYVIFNDYVVWRDSSWTSDHYRLRSGGAIDYRFDGLDPQKRYSFTATAVRGGFPGWGDYSNRWTQVELAEASSATAAHTAGVINAAQFPADLTGTQVAFNSGVNVDGDVVAWEGIVPGPEGAFTVRCTKYSGHFLPGDVTTTATAEYAYSLCQLKLEEEGTNVSSSVTSANPNRTTTAAAPSARGDAVHPDPVSSILMKGKLILIRAVILGITLIGGVLVTRLALKLFKKHPTEPAQAPPLPPREE